jgi:hypothetical protein
MAKLVLLGHMPNSETVESLRALLGAETKILTYNFHVDQLKDLHKAVVGLVMNLNSGAELELADEIIIGAPGLSAASFLLPSAVQGLTGKMPKLLNMIRVTGNRYLPCPECPIIDTEQLYGYMRKKRRSVFL